MEYLKTDRNKVRRIPTRAHYDQRTVWEILDAGCLCHVGFVSDGQPFVIPTLYGRDGDSVFLHGAAASRMLKDLASGIDVCLSVAHADGLVLARSAFHHSMNYRSVVLFGKAVEVNGDEKERGLFMISEGVLKGRWAEARPPSEKELNATSVLKLAIDSASAKVRTGPPVDDEEDHSLPIWAGVIPIRTRYGPPQPAPDLADAIPIPESISALIE